MPPKSVNPLQFLTDAHVAIVAGKGGVGKTTVTAVLARAAADQGLRVLVVELDGYGSHGNRAAFMYDRHRDYELALSGYTVLRLANDEIAQDIEKAVEKIRDLVRMRRPRISQED